MKIVYICIAIFIFLGATNSLPGSIWELLGLIVFLGLPVIAIWLSHGIMK
jgi:hypothetical protein